MRVGQEAQETGTLRRRQLAPGPADLLQATPAARIPGDHPQLQPRRWRADHRHTGQLGRRHQHGGQWLPAAASARQASDLVQCGLFDAVMHNMHPRLQRRWVQCAQMISYHHRGIGQRRERGVDPVADHVDRSHTARRQLPHQCFDRRPVHLLKYDDVATAVENGGRRGVERRRLGGLQRCIQRLRAEARLRQRRQHVGDRDSGAGKGPLQRRAQHPADSHADGCGQAGRCRCCRAVRRHQPVAISGPVTAAVTAAITVSTASSASWGPMGRLSTSAANWSANE